MEMNPPPILRANVKYDPDLIYFAVAEGYFFIYNPNLEQWKDLKSGYLIEQSFEDSFQPDGTMFLPIKGLLPTKGMWFYAEYMDDVLDFYNNEEYKKFL